PGGTGHAPVQSAGRGRACVDRSHGPQRSEGDRGARRTTSGEAGETMRTTRLIALCLAFVTLLALGIETSAGAATAKPHAKTPTFKAIGPVDSNVLSMSSDGPIAVGDFIFGGGAFRWVRGQGTTLLGDAGGQVSVSRD